MAEITWTKVCEPIKLEVMTSVTPTKGNLVYEYNPFRNYRLTKNMYEYKDQLYSLQELEDIYHLTTSDQQHWLLNGQEVTGENLPVLREPGELVDFITDELSFDLNHPVNITPQYSYDGSVNLILNDGINPPRLINSRFSATGRNTYEIVDRKGNNDTNIYDQGEAFEIDTSLYKQVSKIPKIKFKGCSAGGNLKVGNYFFYFKLSDADGNETDFVGESGLVSVFIGFNDPQSIHTGQKNENSFKSVTFLLENLDISYDYVYAYYSRATAEGTNNSVTEYKKIDRKFTINNAGICNMVITGFENTQEISAADINLNYNIVDAAKTAATCQNMLFLGNVHKPNIPYEELFDLSLRFLPYLKEEQYPLDMNENYEISSQSSGYYDEQFIYEKTGYWAGELYRLGIVYILPNGELTPVFNIRGGLDIAPFSGDSSKENYIDQQWTDYPFWINSAGNRWKEGDREKIRYKIPYNETTNYLIPFDDNDRGKVANENCKGVVKYSYMSDTNTIHSLDIRVDKNTIEELKKYTKGFFFVRQPRIPTILAQGITMAVDQTSFTPTITTAGGVLDELKDSLDKTHVTTNNILDVNNISEGFLSRYQFKFKAKSSKLWNKIWKAAAVSIAVVALAVATVYTGGAALAVVGGATAAAAATAGAAAVTTAFAIGSLGIAASVGIIAGATVATTVTTMATAATIQEIRYAASRTLNVKKLDGRNTKCPSGYKIVETDDSRLLDHDFRNRIIIKDPTKVKVQAILCPDYEVNQPYYNQIFTGNTHTIQLTVSQNINAKSGLSSNYFNNDDRHFYVPNYYDMNVVNSYNFKIIGVPDDCPVAGIGDLKFRARAGNAEEPWRYECIGDDYKSEHSKKNADEDEETRNNKTINSDIIRGSFGPYLAFNDEDNKFSPAETVNIFIPEYSPANITNYINIRMQDDSIYSAITERIGLVDIEEHSCNPLSKIDIANGSAPTGPYKFNAYRGDCYICQFTHRLNRNFNAPSSPYNDEIVDTATWRENYDPDQPEKMGEINLGDVNAVKLGMWVTFRVRSSRNLNIRTLDGSNIDESAQTGNPRGYFPQFGMNPEGAYKKPDAQVYNSGFSKNLSERWNFNLPDVPYIKNWFGTRIMYSDIHINDSYKNGYRIFRGMNYRDYTREYGEIVKLVPLDSSLICVFEHGIALIPVNERTIAGQGSGGNVYINTSNVLPENPKIISDMFGSQWADSILKVQHQGLNAGAYVYGVDTVAKKIWRTNGSSIECISDFKVQEFLNNNITLSERENTPILGIRNVKTVYNAFKHDVMFTFYDNTYGFEEKVWNLCFNELMNHGQGAFVTFYSWVPSFMENINNVPFSFNRNVSKWIAKLGTSHAENSFADGVTLSNNVINNYFMEGEDNKALVDNNQTTVQIQLANGDYYYDTFTVSPEDMNAGFIGVLGLSNRVLPDQNLFYTISYTLERDPWGNHKMFEIKQIGSYYISKEAIYNGQKAKYPEQNIPIYGLFLRQTTDQDTQFPPVYTEPELIYNVYIDPYKGTKVCTKAVTISQESLMSELYYRNIAGHYYADHDNNKVKYKIKTEITTNEGILQPDEIYDINYLVAYTLSLGNINPEIIPYAYRGWIGMPIDQLNDKVNELTGGKNGTQNSDVIVEIAKCLLKENGGPFEGTSKVYLGTKEKPSACRGDLATLIKSPKSHAPFAKHFMFGADIDTMLFTREQLIDLPPFKDLSGKRLMLPKEERVREDQIVTLLAIKAHVTIEDTINTRSLSDNYYNMKASYIDAAEYESIVGVTTKWNLQFLTSDFWKHGQAGLIDIADDIFPTYWYGKQHPFEFEFIVVDDPSVHKIFTNLELIANKAKPESFHYEVIGEAYDFAKDKVNMYFRQEAIKALWQYNGLDIQYDRNFLKVQPKQNPKSADLLRTYFARKQSVNDVEDYYYSASGSNADYRHLSGGEIVYYPTRQEFRVWNHVKAVDVDDQPDTTASVWGGRGLIASNMRYLEDRWRVTINPLLVVYRNEYTHGLTGTTWVQAYNDKTYFLPPLPIYNSPIPDAIKAAGKIDFPGVPTKAGTDESEYGRTNALYHLYDTSLFGVEIDGKRVFHPLDTVNWLNTNTTYRTDFGTAQNRKETDMRDKFIKVRIRYSGEELAVIDWINTIYQISYA